MKTLLAILFATLLAATSHGQTVKALSYNVTNSTVIWTNTNTLTFSNAIQIDGNGTIKIDGQAMYWEDSKFFDAEAMEFYDYATSELALRIGYDINSQDPSSFNTTYTALAFGGTNAALHAAQTRTNLGLGATNDVTFRNVSVIENDIKLATTMEDEGATVLIKRGTNEDVPLLNLGFSNNTIQSFVPIGFNNNTTNAATTRTNLGLPLAALTNDSNVTLMRALSGSTNTNHPFSGSISVVGTNNTNTLVFSNGILQEVQ